MEREVFYVYMHNVTSSKDDEVYKVLALSEDDAKRVAAKGQEWRGRFTVGWVKADTPANQEYLKAYAWWATDHTRVS